MRQSDVGRIIGRNGQTIQAIRTLLSARRRATINAPRLRSSSSRRFFEIG